MDAKETVSLALSVPVPVYECAAPGCAATATGRVTHVHLEHTGHSDCPCYGLNDPEGDETRYPHAYELDDPIGWVFVTMRRRNGTKRTPKYASYWLCPDHGDVAWRA